MTPTKTPARASKAAPKAAPKPRARKPPKPVVGANIIGDMGRARVATELIASVQTDREKVFAMMTANGHKPAERLVLGDGTVTTYAARMKTFSDAEERLWAAYSDVRELIDGLIAELRSREAAS